jgi:hypothetical protein
LVSTREQNPQVVEQVNDLLCHGSSFLPRRRRRKPLHMESASVDAASSAMSHSSTTLHPIRHHQWSSNGHEHPHSCEASTYPSRITSIKRDPTRSHSQRTFLWVPTGTNTYSDGKLYIPEYTREETASIMRPQTVLSHQTQTNPVSIKQLNRVRSIRPLDLVPTRPSSVRKPTRSLSLREPTRPSSVCEPPRSSSVRKQTRSLSVREPTRPSSVCEPTRSSSVRVGVDSLPVLHSSPSLPTPQPPVDSITNSSVHLKAVAHALIAVSRGTATASLAVMAWERKERLEINALRRAK